MSRPASDLNRNPAPLDTDSGSVAPWLAKEVDAACRRVAPLWPLDRFVAVNPFLGLTDMPFHAATHRLAAMGQRALAPSDYYRSAIARHKVDEQDLRAAMQIADRRGHAAHLAPEQLLAYAGVNAGMEQAPAGLGSEADADGEVPRLPSLATWFDMQTASQWHSIVIDEISKWCSCWFDRGQATWPMPWQHLPLYQAWREAAMHDHDPAVLGLAWHRELVGELPQQPMATIAEALKYLDLPQELVGFYLETCLRDIAGWAGAARQRQWDAELAGKEDDTPAQLLAVRVAWDLLLVRQLASGDQAHLLDDWRQHFADTVRWRLREAPKQLAPDAACLVQSAMEHHWQQQLFAELRGHEPAPTHDAVARADVQAVFCIDVRSEVYRRALEAQGGRIDTLGFAGFFGFPVAWHAPGEQEAMPQCPVLLAPAAEVTAEPADRSPEALKRAQGKLAAATVFKRAWKTFKTSAVSCFAFVEALGAAYVEGLLEGALRRQGRPVGERAAAVRPTPAASPKLVAGPWPTAPGTGRTPSMPVDESTPASACDGSPCTHETPMAGLSLEEQTAMAEGALRGMSLTQGFARLVLICGHGSTTTNNPYQAGLDCGACGGQTGAVNARIAATVLNTPAVREALAAKGIDIPGDTVFIGALHDTTTDEVSIFDTDELPTGHGEDLARLHEWLRGATAACRGERAPALGLAEVTKPSSLRNAVLERSRDWSEVRPEWALARNAAFIAAPRALTREVALNGRAFLHEYDWRQDENFQVLELIMTAPMVVASWINLQYYASTVNNRAFGSGNKTLHNVVSQLGVLSGNGGDLRVGLPWQSVHDGEDFHHEPLRLTVVLAAPKAQIDAILERHPDVRNLVANEWLHLFAVDDAGRIERCLDSGQWETQDAA
jgi:uncharacterized protein YbcC (UPF0753/DUF2309 family)